MEPCSAFCQYSARKRKNAPVWTHQPQNWLHSTQPLQLSFLFSLQKGKVVPTQGVKAVDERTRARGGFANHRGPHTATDKTWSKEYTVTGGRVYGDTRHPLTGLGRKADFYGPLRRKAIREERLPESLGIGNAKVVRGRHYGRADVQALKGFTADEIHDHHPNYRCWNKPPVRGFPFSPGQGYDTSGREEKWPPPDLRTMRTCYGGRAFGGSELRPAGPRRVAKAVRFATASKGDSVTNRGLESSLSRGGIHAAVHDLVPPRAVDRRSAATTRTGAPLEVPQSACRGITARTARRSTAF